jgi:hypothetical protein
VPAEPCLIWIAKRVSPAPGGRRDVAVPAELGPLTGDGRMILLSRWRAALDVRDVTLEDDDGTVRFAGLRVLPHDDADEFEERASAVLRRAHADLAAGLTVGDEIARGAAAAAPVSARRRPGP